VKAGKKRVMFLSKNNFDFKLIFLVEWEIGDYIVFRKWFWEKVPGE
jgi:hypothetical protein